MRVDGAGLLLDTLRIGSRLTPSQIAAWNDPDVRAVVDLAAMDGAALWLSRQLTAVGATLNPAAHDALKTEARRTIAVGMRIDAEVDASLAILRAAGVPAVLLKGAAMRRVATRIPGADLRGPSDVDILVQSAVAQHAWKSFVAAGYASQPPTLTSHHLPVLNGPSGVAVEIHTSSSPLVPPDEAWRRATCDGGTGDLQDAPVNVPGDTELLWHAASHAVKHVLEDPPKGMRLTRWLDALVILASGVPIDWDRIRARLDTPEPRNANLVRAWFLGVAEWRGHALSAGALGHTSVTPLNLRRLLAWRLAVMSRHAEGRWRLKLLDEGARAEATLPMAPAAAGVRAYVRARHAIATRAARAWWRLRR